MKHKYLENIGVHSYPDNNYGSRNKIKNVYLKFKNTHKTGVDTRDCWDLDIHFYRWLYEHICQFLDDASKVIVIDTYEIDYNDDTYSIRSLCELLKSYLVDMINYDEFKDVPMEYKDFRWNEINQDDIDNISDIYIKNENARIELKKNIFKVFYTLIDYLWW